MSDRIRNISKFHLLILKYRLLKIKCLLLQPVLNSIKSFTLKSDSVGISVLKMSSSLVSIRVMGVRAQGPVVQSIVSLTSLLRVISLTVLMDSIHNILIFFAEKM